MIAYAGGRCMACKYLPKSVSATGRASIRTNSQPSETLTAQRRDAISDCRGHMTRGTPSAAGRKQSAQKCHDRNSRKDTPYLTDSALWIPQD
jgi:hypothetical protein